MESSKVLKFHTAFIKNPSCGYRTFNCINKVATCTTLNAQLAQSKAQACGSEVFIALSASAFIKKNRSCNDTSFSEMPDRHVIEFTSQIENINPSQEIILS